MKRLIMCEGPNELTLINILDGHKQTVKYIAGIAI